MIGRAGSAAMNNCRTRTQAFLRGATKRTGRTPNCTSNNSTSEQKKTFMSWRTTQAQQQQQRQLARTAAVLHTIATVNNVADQRIAASMLAYFEEGEDGT
mmetsp:Transcript_342/g.467  ORF Transcript_342/g.467 Transcript_342/m.467 type:complete len:100 (-) Transcript_342:195-494(-)